MQTLYISRNHKGTFYYRDRFWSFDNGIEKIPPTNATYCTYCAAPGSIFVVKRYLELLTGYEIPGSFKSMTVSCEKHKNGEIQMGLTDAQRDLYNKVFIEQKELLSSHPFMDEDPVTGQKKVNREKVIELLNNLTEAEFMLRTKQQAVIWVLEDAIKDESESGKAAIRAYDKTHRNKSGLEIEQEKRKVSSGNGGVSKEEKLILSVMERLSCDRAAAIAWIAE